MNQLMLEHLTLTHQADLRAEAACNQLARAGRPDDETTAATARRLIATIRSWIAGTASPRPPAIPAQGSNA